MVKSTGMLGIALFGFTITAAIPALGDTNSQSCTHNGIPVDCETGEPLDPDPDEGLTTAEACPERQWDFPYGIGCNYRVENLEYIAVKIRHAYGGAGFDADEELTEANGLDVNDKIVGQATTSTGELHAVKLSIGPAYHTDIYFDDFGVTGLTSSAYAIGDNQVVMGQNGDTATWWYNSDPDALTDIPNLFTNSKALAYGRNYQQTMFITGHGTFSSDNLSHGFIWCSYCWNSANNNYSEVAFVLGGHGVENHALSINDSSIAVGYYNNNGIDKAFSAGQSGALVDLSDDGMGSRALDINNNAQAIITGYVNEGATQHAVYWTGNTRTTLPALNGATNNAATALADGGDIVGYSGDKAVIWRDETVYDLNQLVVSGTNASFTRAIDINWPGRILVEATDGFYLLIPTESSSDSFNTLEVATTADDVEEAWQTLSFQRSYNAPVFIAALVTYDGPDTAGLRMRNLSGNAVDIMVEEEGSQNSEVNHTTEAVGYMVVETGDIVDRNGNTIGEAGSISSDQANGDTWHTTTLNNSYNNPVVIMQPLTYNDSHPSHVRLNNITGNSFQFQIEEWDYLDQEHATETGYYVVLESGRHQLSDMWIEAGTVSANQSWTTVNYSGGEASDTPVVIAQIQTYNDTQAVVTRQRRTKVASFQVRVQEEEANDDVHDAETAGYIAVGR